MKRGSRILLFLVIVIIILIGVAFFVLRGSLTGGSSATPTTSPMVNIVVVGQPIKIDQEITPESLTTLPYPQNMVNEKMVTDMQQVVGKFATMNLDQGLPMTTNMVTDRLGQNGAGTIYSRKVSPGLVAISIPISQLGSVSYGISDQDRVNIIATNMFVDVDSNFQSKLPNYTAKVTGPGFIPDTLPILSASVASGGPGSEQGRAELDPTVNQALYLVPSEAQRPRLVSQMILQDIQVLHVGVFPAQQDGNSTAPAQEAAAATPTVSPNITPDLITLIVTPQDAVALTYLMYSGARFTLTLRAPDDTTRVETEAATLQYLLSQYAIPLPAKLPYVMDNKSLPIVPKISEPAIPPVP